MSYTTTNYSTSSGSSAEPKSSTSSIFKDLPTLINKPIKAFQTQYQHMSYRSRILKEVKALETSDLPGIKLQLSDNLHVFYVDISITNNKLYQDQIYRLKIMLPKNYPFVAPITIFVKNVEENIFAIPIHPHIYSNGHICLDLLGPAWTPAHNLTSLVISIQSLLGSNSINERPQDDERYVAKGSKNPAKTKFIYHDDNV